MATRLHKRRTTRTELIFHLPSSKRIALLLVSLVAVGLIALLLWVFHLCYFRNNPTFTLPSLTNVTVEGCETLSPEMVLMQLRITKGINLFSVDTGALRQSIAENMPAVKDSSIRLILPDKMHIRLEERMPVARVEEHRLNIDAEGVIFPRRLRASLPVIVGLRNCMTVQPGAQLPETQRAVLDLALALQRNKYTFQVQEIRLTDNDPLDLLMTDQRFVKLAWDDMDKPSIVSLRNMESQLSLLSQVYRSDFARNKLHFNATVQGRITAE